jgi:hypothetical protein
MLHIDLLPNDVTCAKETRDLIIECCVGELSLVLYILVLTDFHRGPEFIHLISSEANEICDQESKKTIAPEHIIGALRVRLYTYNFLTMIYSISAARFRLIYHRG